MNISVLHHYLTRLSESELRYQAGQIYDGWNHLDKTTIDGRKVYIMPSSDAAGASGFALTGDSPVLPSARADDTRDFLSINTALPALKIKQTSRFNPVPEHVHAYIEINYVYSGQCPQVIDGKPVVLKKNQVLLIDTACPHSIGSLGENDIMISMLVSKKYLRDHVFSQFSQDSILSRFFINAINEKTNHDHFLLFHAENDRRIPLFFRELFCECFDPSINSTDIMTHLFYTIMAELINVYENDLARETDFSDGTPIVAMIRYIENNFRSCTQNSVADFFHISPNYVSVLLKKHTGMSYIQLIQEQRLKYAANQLAASEYSVTDIAHDAGYENISFFYKKFKERYRCLPGEYREGRV